MQGSASRRGSVRRRGLRYQSGRRRRSDSRHRAPRVASRRPLVFFTGSASSEHHARAKTVGPVVLKSAPWPSCSKLSERSFNAASDCCICNAGGGSETLGQVEELSTSWIFERHDCCICNWGRVPRPYGCCICNYRDPSREGRKLGHSPRSMTPPGPWLAQLSQATPQGVGARHVRHVRTGLRTRPQRRSSRTAEARRYFGSPKSTCPPMGLSSARSPRSRRSWSGLPPRPSKSATCTPVRAFPEPRKPTPRKGALGGGTRSARAGSVCRRSCDDGARSPDTRRDGAAPKLDQPLPYAYARTRQETPLFERDPAKDNAVRDVGKLSREKCPGDCRLLERPGPGRQAEKAPACSTTGASSTQPTLEAVQSSTSRAARLNDKLSLPIAFVVKRGVRYWKVDKTDAEKLGKLEYHTIIHFIGRSLPRSGIAPLLGNE